MANYDIIAQLQILGNTLYISLYMDMYMLMRQSGYSLKIFGLLSKQHPSPTLLRFLV